MTAEPLILIRVLLVEDNPEDAEIFCLELMKATVGRFAVQTADRLSVGIALAKEGNVDVVVLDLSLPDSMGIGTLEKMIEAAPTIPIVVLTGAQSGRLGLEEVNKGAQDYLVKGEFSAHTIARALLFAIERRLLQEQLTRRDELLARRMNSIGTLASGIAHEINNPLSYVMSNLEVVSRDLQELGQKSPSSRIRLTEIVDQARQGAERVRRIIDGLKIFSRADVEETRVPLELSSVLELAISLTSNDIRNRARLVRDYAPAPCVEADEARLSQVFVNLLVNAAQAIGDGAVDENEIRVVTSTDSEGRAVVEIRDTGSGISEAHRSQIFDPFFTTKPVGVGTGLGLSIVQGIVTTHGGTITFESPWAGKGTAFRVVLPPARPDVHSVRSASIPTAPHAVASRRGSVLVVDDEPTVAMVLRRILAPDHDVVIVGNGRQALDRFEAGERFDVILCDLMMPVMNGIGLYEQLSKTIPEQASRIVFITGGAFTPDAKSFLDRVPNNRVRKPFESVKLRGLVQTLVRGTKPTGEAHRPDASARGVP
jgi:signal transduction histidine kinase